MARTAREGHALVSVGLLPVLRRPDHRAERVTDAPLGTPLRSRGGPADEWWEVRLADGYRGFARALGLVPCAAPRAARFAAAPRLLEQSAEVRANPEGEALAFAPAGSRLVVTGRSRGWIRVELPDGSRGVVRARLAPRPRAFTPAGLVAHARRLVGVPYLWGGRSGWGLDCSGLVQLAADLAGLDLPRDARDQSRAGRAVGARKAEGLLPGDLLFFGPSPARTTHVAIYVGAGKYVHSLGWVRENSLRPDQLDSLDSLLKYFRGARRLGGPRRR
jgi:gamma-D-glutamyl-L-lysine dipeptidyl-peptidase